MNDVDVSSARRRSSRCLRLSGGCHLLCYSMTSGCHGNSAAVVSNEGVISVKVVYRSEGFVCVALVSGSADSCPVLLCICCVSSVHSVHGCVPIVRTKLTWRVEWIHTPWTADQEKSGRADQNGSFFWDVA